MRNQRPDDPEGLRQFKAEFFKALGHPLRIRILEILRHGPTSVGKLTDLAGAPESSISQQLAVLRSRNIVVTERRGTTVIYRIRDAELSELLDVARRIFNLHLTDAIDLLRMVESESVAAESTANAGSAAGDTGSGLADAVPVDNRTSVR